MSVVAIKVCFYFGFSLYSLFISINRGRQNGFKDFQDMTLLSSIAQRQLKRA